MYGDIRVVNTDESKDAKRSHATEIKQGLSQLIKSNPVLYYDRHEGDSTDTYHKETGEVEK